jgi:hypothetical protein
LQRAQKTLRVLPKQRFENAAEFSQVVENNRNRVIDATEREHFRHPNEQHQRQHFRGRKQRHTVKNTVLATTAKGLVFVGKTVPGSRHDYALLKQEFAPREDWFKSVTVSVD